MPYFFLLFVIMPIAEIAVFIQVGGAIGGWTTIGIVILTAIIGTVMLRQQGLATLSKAQQRLQNGEMPAQQMLEGLLLVIGGILLLTPGFITDFFGFCTLVPFSREFLAKKLSSGAFANMNVSVGGSTFSAGARARPRQNQVPGGRPSRQSDANTATDQSVSGKKPSPSGDSDVLEGDYERLD